MSIRRLLAGSIVALLLSVSSLAAACEVSCAYASAGSDCHSSIAPAASRDAGMDMAGMDMSGMTIPSMTNAEDQPSEPKVSQPKSHHPTIGAMGLCEGQSCDNNSSLSAQANGSACDLLHSLVATAHVSRAGEAQPLFHGAREDIALDRARDGSPLQISLRI